MKKISFSLRFFAIFFVLLALCLLWLINIENDGKELSEKVIRLHILADSDKEEAQRLKLLVRNEVLSLLPAYLDGCSSAAEAALIINNNLSRIKQTAEATLRKNGCFLPVSAELQKELFEQRDYETFSLPAGEYEALKLVIGEGKGHNWWCVVFPPLCLTSSIEDNEAVLAVLDEDELELITTDKYVIKFKILEFIAQFKKKLDHRK
jgi:stage II sporulation protein R